MTIKKLAAKVYTVYTDYDPFNFPFDDVTVDTIVEDIESLDTTITEELWDIAQCYYESEEYQKQHDILLIARNIEKYQMKKRFERKA